MTLINSTVSGNSAAGNAGGINLLGESTILSSTITGNIADSDNDGNAGGGLQVGNVNNQTIQNTIVAGNFVNGAVTADDIAGSASKIVNPINNVIGDSGSVGGISDGVNGNIVGNNGSGTITTSTILNTTLANNGCPTLTHELVVGSPALDAGSNTEANNAGLTTDQRGTGFPRIVNSTVDIGAYELELFDFGDGPTLTSLGDDGARHVPTGLTLGITRDAEGNGVPSANADSDDITNTADEDGVTFGTIQVGQQNVSITVNVQGGSGKLDAWIDFNGDGIFSGDGEQIADDLSVSTGDSTVTFDVPACSLSGNVIGRFRLSTAGNLDPTGEAADDEVEDYAISITPPSGSGTFVAAANTPNGAANNYTLADIDGDGDLDFLVGSSRLRRGINDGNGRR
ncbi:MAG: hypothetical protein CMJ78_22765 [Planctomycetaceae bacterium]|nr:hypothetical protein [Planctomycetaceae bacterium]